MVYFMSGNILLFYISILHSFFDSGSASNSQGVTIPKGAAGPAGSKLEVSA
jgi:hypothetical protein